MILKDQAWSHPALSASCLTMWLLTTLYNRTTAINQLPWGSHQKKADGGFMPLRFKNITYINLLVFISSLCQVFWYSTKILTSAMEYHGFLWSRHINLSNLIYQTYFFFLKLKKWSPLHLINFSKYYFIALISPVSSNKILWLVWFNQKTYLLKFEKLKVQDWGAGRANSWWETLQNTTFVVLTW